ncbi:MAG: Type 1 glutamine amidotransferase-like domain-containing protein [Candidatus Paceibacterota bacterium]|jgi:dipeptidase E
MKLLLTSGGITNKTLADALVELAGKPREEITLAFVPTAANASDADKVWFIDNLYQLKQQQYKKVMLVEISGLPKSVWQPWLLSADIIVFSGGSTPHLMYWLEKSGLKDLLPELLKTKVYVGISAGSIVTGPTLATSNKEKNILYKERFGYATSTGLGLVDFSIRPHLNSETSPHSKEELLEQIAKEIPQTIYGLDDQMAIKVVDGEVEVIGEGKYVVFNK